MRKNGVLSVSISHLVSMSFWLKSNVSKILNFIICVKKKIQSSVHILSRRKLFGLDLPPIKSKVCSYFLRETAFLLPRICRSCPGFMRPIPERLEYF